MKHTNNYHLPKWSEDDLILMSDFNSAMENIESGIDGAKAEADAKCTELDRKINAANTKADAAQAAAAKRPYVTGSYTGRAAGQTIYCGFRPSFVIISGMTESASDLNGVHYSAISGGKILTDVLTFTDTGFTVNFRFGYSPNLTEMGITYDYIAFK